MQTENLKTPVIRYSLKERGRKFRGVERSFDIAAIVATINGGTCQERVKHRDMHGYYGHWPRVRFGMNPAEGGMDSGKAVAIEPALVTVLLKADADGTVQHQAEFLPTQAGQLAAKLFQARAGGFSSAIDTLKPEFFGFDYVLEPNYSTNRGYSLDSVLCEGGACGIAPDVVDSIIYDEHLAGMAQLLDSTQSLHQASLLAMDGLRKELKHTQAVNADLLSRLMALDAVKGKRPVTWGSVTTAERMVQQAQGFRQARLLMPRTSDKPQGAEVEMPAVYHQILDGLRHV